jgi:pimeloyl-ACP methyl ester carboxylesterase
MKTLAWWIGILLLALGVTALSGRSGMLDTDPAEAEARYGGPPSKFALIDGTRIHYRDEGSGPVVVMLHGSRASLHQWDGWVAALGGRFRTVRLDLAAHGLTGADGRDDLTAERQIAQVEGLVRELGLGRFVLVGTSSGSTVSVRYAADHPERVEKLVLSTVPLRLPTQPRTAPLDRFVFWFHDKVLGTTATRVYWRTFLRSIYGDPSKVTEAQVERYRALNNLPGREREFRARIASWRSRGGPERDYRLAAGVRAPVLIQWGVAGPVLPRELHCQIAEAFKSTTVRVISYPDLGHKLVMEDPQRTARDALAFIVDGTGGETCATPR